MTRVAAAFGRLFDALAAIAALILLAMVVAVTADIVLRNTVRAEQPESPQSAQAQGAH